MAKLFIVHGVGSFQEGKVLEAVRRQASRYRIANGNVSAFNWDERVDRVFGPRGALNLGVLSRMSEGALNAANLGFASRAAYAGIPRWGIDLINTCALLMQSSAILWLPLVIGSVFSRDVRWLGMALVAVLVGCFIGTIGVSTESGRAIRAIIRRVVLTVGGQSSILRPWRWWLLSYS
jgi:hypothetical protein